MANNNKQRNFLTQQLDRYGENWLQLIKPEDIQNNVKRIVKEIVLGKINYEVIGKYFLEPKFTENLIIALSNELEINTLYYNAVAFYQQYYPDYTNIGVQINHLQILCYVYSVIFYRLQAVEKTQNIGYMVDLSPILFVYRNHL